MNFDWISKNISTLDWNQMGLSVLNAVLYIAVILVVARLVYGLIVYLLRRMLVDRKGKHLLDERKANTLFSLLRSMLIYAITFAAIMQALNHFFNLNTGTLLASASILGVALGFGSQSLVKDVISGFFILFEDQFSVGDYIKTGNFSGTVEETGIRTTRIRAWGGELHIIPNGSITAVTNYSRGKMLAMVDIQVPYDEDLERTIEVLHSVCANVSEGFGDIIIEAPEVQGVIQFGERYIVLRVVAFTKPNEQWGLERELRRQIHRAFLKEGIQTPQQNFVVPEHTKDPI